MKLLVAVASNVDPSGGRVWFPNGNRTQAPRRGVRRSQLARPAIGPPPADCRHFVYFIASPGAASSPTSGSPRTTPIITSLQTLRLSSGTRRKLLVVSGSSRPAPPAQCQEFRVFGESSGRFLFGKCQKAVHFLGLLHYDEV